MNTNECLKILRQIKDVAFATVDEKGYPQIRIVHNNALRRESPF